MNIIEWLSKKFDAGDVIIYGLIAFVICFFSWKLINKVLKKHKLHSLLELGAIGSFGILIFLLLIVVLFVASIQAAIEHGIKLIFPLLIFWGGFIAFVIFFIKKFKE